ncbi:DUF4262 domain-containing protein [Phenylobacterium sp.]|uniref:DUF4262 domain-containing protein n=1 Tax=Phenylobacterium sp. TaxID=1871053 RepID=UPI002ED89E11
MTSQLGRRIEEHGWTAVYVGDYSTAPTWTYTIGFDETLGQPEVIVFDIPQDSANALLWEVFAQIKDGRLILEDGKVWPEGEELAVRLAQGAREPARERDGLVHVRDHEEPGADGNAIRF